MHDAFINLLAHTDQSDLIDQGARLMGKNRSDFILEAACEKAQEVMLDQVHFRLDEKSFQKLQDLLDASPSPSPALDHLLSTQAPWDISNKAHRAYTGITAPSSNP